jgi:hypothetical protein
VFIGFDREVIFMKKCVFFTIIFLIVAGCATPSQHLGVKSKSNYFNQPILEGYEVISVIYQYDVPNPSTHASITKAISEVLPRKPGVNFSYDSNKSGLFKFDPPTKNYFSSSEREKIREPDCINPLYSTSWMVSGYHKAGTVKPEQISLQACLIVNPQGYQLAFFSIVKDEAGSDAIQQSLGRLLLAPALYPLVYTFQSLESITENHEGVDKALSIMQNTAQSISSKINVPAKVIFVYPRSGR